MYCTVSSGVYIGCYKYVNCSCNTRHKYERVFTEQISVLLGSRKVQTIQGKT